MKTLLALALVLLMCAPAMPGTDDEKACPSDKAADAGQAAFDSFHKVMAPAWHEAWPSKNYDALIAAGPEFRRAYAAVAELLPPNGSEAKKSYFSKCREEFGALVEAYAAAAGQGDREKVYELLPALHEAFEKTAASSVKIPFEEMDSLAVTIGLILETHLPQNNRDGLAASTDALLAKLDGIAEHSLPVTPRYSKREAMIEITAMKSVAADMKECCDNNAMGSYRRLATDFSLKLKNFVTKYL